MQIIFNENLQKNVGKNLPYDIQVVDSQYDQKVTYQMVHHKCSDCKIVGHPVGRDSNKEEESKKHGMEDHKKQLLNARQI